MSVSVSMSMSVTTTTTVAVMFVTMVMMPVVVVVVVFAAAWTTVRSRLSFLTMFAMFRLLVRPSSGTLVALPITLFGMTRMTRMCMRMCMCISMSM